MLPWLFPFCVPPAPTLFLAEAGAPTLPVGPAFPLEKKIR
jgi:hypothetical protein